MTFDEYQKQAIKTALNPSRDFEAIVYRTLGLVGEAGEFAEKIKKIIRDKNNQIGKTDKEQLITELGDVLWYLSALATMLDTNLSEIAQKNLNKVFSRKARGVTRGKGDNR